MLSPEPDDDVYGATTMSCCSVRSQCLRVIARPAISIAAPATCPMPSRATIVRLLDSSPSLQVYVYCPLPQIGVFRVASQPKGPTTGTANQPLALLKSLLAATDKLIE